MKEQEWGVPDFSGWQTSRIKFLLPDYQSSIGICAKLYGHNHPETVMYRQWVAAMEAELKKREE
jgi:hypothetical protein